MKVGNWVTVGLNETKLYPLIILISLVSLLWIFCPFFHCYNFDYFGKLIMNICLFSITRDLFLIWLCLINYLPTLFVLLSPLIYQTHTTAIILSIWLCLINYLLTLFVLLTAGNKTFHTHTIMHYSKIFFLKWSTVQLIGLVRDNGSTFNFIFLHYYYDIAPFFI